nr:RNA-directed DNA polymerase, eukaryota, reverse transcriptase zinc-binding domain protein [Tanacetum cinerariifolium]
NNLVIRGILVDGAWNEDPKTVKNEFISHFEDRYWCDLEPDVVNDVNHFFKHGFCPRGGNSSFIALIPKTLDVKQILDGPFILNELIQWCKAKKKETMLFKVDFEKAFDFVHDVVFMGQWCDSNINTTNHVLECFFRASRLRINIQKSKLMGVVVEDSKVDLAAHNIGCTTLKLPFIYLGVKVGSRMSRINSWDEIINNLLHRLSKWKEKGGLGVSSFYALNRALIFKWDWRFRTQNFSLWSRVIKAIHGEDGKLCKSSLSGSSSNWIDIVRDISLLKNKGIDLFDSIKKKVGN